MRSVDSSDHTGGQLCRPSIAQSTAPILVPQLARHGKAVSYEALAFHLAFPPHRLGFRLGFRRLGCREAIQKRLPPLQPGVG